MYPMFHVPTNTLSALPVCGAFNSLSTLGGSESEAGAAEVDLLSGGGAI